jgi:hypothetical protein
MSELTFEIRPSPETNDHEVVVLVDGSKVLDDDFMGIDPPEFFAQFSKTRTGQLLIGRCRCGVVGCGDYLVTVEIAPEIVTWWGAKEFRFERAEYDKAIQRAASDFSWEDQQRRAERLAKMVLDGCRTEDGFTFQWASARIKPMSIELSFQKHGQQRMLEFGWDGATDQSAVEGAKRFRREHDGGGSTAA